MIAIHELWPFTKSSEPPAEQASKLGRKVLGQGLKTNQDGSGGVGKVLGSIAKRNKLLAQAAGQD